MPSIIVLYRSRPLKVCSFKHVSCVSSAPFWWNWNTQFYCVSMWWKMSIFFVLFVTGIILESIRQGFEWGEFRHSKEMTPRFSSSVLWSFAYSQNMDWQTLSLPVWQDGQIEECGILEEKIAILNLNGKNVNQFFC